MPWPFSTNHCDEGPMPGRSQAERDAALTRIWDATRPLEPSDAAWDNVWARVRDHIDQPEGATLKLPARNRRRTAVTVFVLAQAAALLAAVVTWGVQRDPAQTSVVKTIPTPEPALVSWGSVDIVPGQIVMIHADGDRVRAETVSMDEVVSAGIGGFGEFEDFYVMFNRVEAGLEIQLAQVD
jgi:hypothetical protein